MVALDSTDALLTLIDVVRFYDALPPGLRRDVYRLLLQGYDCKEVAALLKVPYNQVSTARRDVWDRYRDWLFHYRVRRNKYRSRGKTHVGLWYRGRYHKPSEFEGGAYWRLPVFKDEDYEYPPVNARAVCSCAVRRAL